MATTRVEQKDHVGVVRGTMTSEGDEFILDVNGALLWRLAITPTLGTATDVRYTMALSEDGMATWTNVTQTMADANFVNGAHSVPVTNSSTGIEDDYNFIRPGVLIGQIGDAGAAADTFAVGVRFNENSEMLFATHCKLTLNTITGTKTTTSVEVKATRFDSSYLYK